MRALDLHWLHYNLKGNIIFAAQPCNILIYPVRLSCLMCGTLLGKLAQIKVGNSTPTLIYRISKATRNLF